ncbi:H/ACA RNA-protein complex protein Gar1 [Candidatus Geothermarchaeota archaeon]|nr:MAG: H/ACA RNA-protein complex protein Gar1 [Candidatus Geothermarchaeota archaeon]HEW93473.1 H/ACA RNA-protein complex protein Gar1 [Thermoprotei archaeon]
MAQEKGWMMKKAGKILHYTKYKVFVIEADSKVIPNTYLIDDRGRKIGLVVDVIGPVSKPYLVVKPLIKDPEKYVGKEVYYTREKRK